MEIARCILFCINALDIFIDVKKRDINIVLDEEKIKYIDDFVLIGFIKEVKL